MPRTRRSLPPTAAIPAAVRTRLNALVDADGRAKVEIALAAGMSRQRLNQLLAGATDNPSVSSVAAILAALGRSWSDLD